MPVRLRLSIRRRHPLFRTTSSSFPVEPSGSRVRSSGKRGEETDSTYQVVFRSYTGALVYFYVDKASGNTRMVESVPALDVDTVTGTINLFDYIDKAN